MSTGWRFPSHALIFGRFGAIVSRFEIDLANSQFSQLLVSHLLFVKSLLEQVHRRNRAVNRKCRRSFQFLGLPRHLRTLGETTRLLSIRVVGDPELVAQHSFPLVVP